MANPEYNRAPVIKYTATTVTINTLNEHWDNLSRELTAWLKQADQVIISTTDADKNIARIRAEFPSVDIVTMPHGDHPGHCPLGSFMQLNNSIPHIKGEWWCFASGNDYVYPNKLRDEVATAKRTAARVVYSDYNYTDENGNAKSRQRLAAYDPIAHEKRNIVPDCSLIHRSILDEFMPFRCDRFRNYSYWDLWLRVHEKYGRWEFAHCPTVTWGYRQGADDMHVKRTRSIEQQEQADNDRADMLESHGITAPTKVVSFCIEDHANFMREQAKALRSVGVRVRDMKLHKHPYGYPDQSEVVDINLLRSAIRDAEFVMVYFSLKSWQTVAPFIRGKKVIMYYAGTEFRLNMSQYLRNINRHVYRSVIALGEFNGRGARNQRYVSVTVDTAALAKYERPIGQGPLVVGHYPSNEILKGTATIRQALANVSGVVVHIDTQLIPYSDSLQRMADCDVYVELFSPTNHGHPYGSFGTTAVEAAAMGKVVITQNLYSDFYAAEYGPCPLILANTPQDITKAVERLRDMPRSEFRTLAEQFKTWAISCHSYSATGQRMKSQVLR